VAARPWWTTLQCALKSCCPMGICTEFLQGVTKVPQQHALRFDQNRHVAHWGMQRGAKDYWWSRYVSQGKQGPVQGTWVGGQCYMTHLPSQYAADACGCPGSLSVQPSQSWHIGLWMQ
jgi:hypothetical protein